MGWTSGLIFARHVVLYALVSVRQTVLAGDAQRNNLVGICEKLLRCCHNNVNCARILFPVLQSMHIQLGGCYN